MYRCSDMRDMGYLWAKLWGPTMFYINVVHHTSCDITRVASWRIDGRKRRLIVIIMELEDMVTFEQRAAFYVHYIYDVFHYPYFWFS